MKEHAITWYEADDGKIFTDELECYEYELNQLYKMSGVILYIRNDRVDWIDTHDDKAYNNVTDIFIDRNKVKANNAFYKFLHDNYGWCLIEEALEGNGSHYHFSESAFEPLKLIS